MSRAAMNPLDRLRIAVANACDLYSAGRSWDFPVYPEWSGRDVLAHLVAWHESFAEIVQAGVRGEIPNIPSGRYSELNQRGVDERAGRSVLELVSDLQSAQRVIEGLAPLIGTEPLPYRKGSREYTFLERLDISCREFESHCSDLRTALDRYSHRSV